jgi:hypothetical protein
LEPVGGCLLNHLDAWKEINADKLIETGIQANWLSPQEPLILENLKFSPNQKHSYAQ